MAYRIYPVAEDGFADYKVKINGKEVALDVARVSKVPFNRRWPGHQRPLDQTELINFLSLSSSEPLFFEITPKRPFENVEIRPLEAGIKPEIKDGIISFILNKSQYFTVEPFGRNNALHIFVDPTEDKRDDLSEVIYFGKGQHYVDTIFLKSNQTVYLDEGAVVYGCIKAIDAENIKIIGRGILDNSKNKEKILFEVEDSANDCAIKNAKRQHTIQLEYCTNVEIEGIIIRDSLVYNVRPVACKNLTIKNVKIIGCWRYNSDGIDMHNCENVLIENCFIRTFDDSICIKGFDCYYDGDVEEAVKKAMYRNGKSYDVFKNVLVKNCVIWNDWGKCLEIGAETRAEEICDITFENCNIIHVSAAVLDSFNIDYACVHDVTYKNISVEYDEVIPELILQRSDKDQYKITNPDYAPDLISVVTAYHYEYSAGGSRRGKTEKINFENIRLYSRQKPTFNFEGYDEAHKTKDISIKNIFWNNRLLKEISDIKTNQFTENIIFGRNKMKAVIFDLDGTLLYTLKDLYLSVNYALEQFNYPTRTYEEVRRFVGNGIRNLMTQACPENIPDFEECLACFKEYYSLHSQDNTVPYDGIMDLLKALKEKNIPCVVVSNKFEAATKELIEKHFNGYFATVVGEGAGIAKKPDPAGVFEVMKRFNVDDKNEIVLIGDAETDIATARNAGIKCITVTWGFRDKDYLTDQGATIFVDKPEEILSYM